MRVPGSGLIVQPTMVTVDSGLRVQGWKVGVYTPTSSGARCGGVLLGCKVWKDGMHRWLRAQGEAVIGSGLRVQPNMVEGST